MRRFILLSMSFCLFNSFAFALAEPAEQTEPVSPEVSQEVSTGSQALIQAAASGNLTEVKRLHKAGVELNTKMGSEQTTALIEAAKHGHIKIVGLLLGAGVDIAQQDAQGNSVLMHAVKARHLEQVKLLRQNGADLNAHNLADETVLMAACSVMGNKDTVRYLLKKRSNAHASSKTGATALHFAAASGADSALRTLIMYEVDLDAQDNKGMTALMLLAGNADTDPVNRMKMAKSLVQEGAQHDLKNKAGATALDLAKAAKDEKLITYLESI